MKRKPIGCSCDTCHSVVKPIRHFVAEDGRILCYKCKTKEKAAGYKRKE